MFDDTSTLLGNLQVEAVCSGEEGLPLCRICESPLVDGEDDGDVCLGCAEIFAPQPRSTP